jgi:ElaB/YqjD/DUF883 family membrane-anchored ribosome-binding protein
MINPNGEEFTQKDPSTTPGASGAQQPMSGGSMPTGSTGGASSGGATTPSRLQGATEKVSTVASDAWRQTRQTAGTARERTEFLLRENPVPTVIGALALGLAIGLAIRYSSESASREVEAKTPLGNVDLSMLTMPFLWPFFKTARRRIEDSAVVVRDNVERGVDRLKDVDVDQYVKPLRKQWRSWTR